MQVQTRTQTGTLENAAAVDDDAKAIFDAISVYESLDKNIHQKHSKIRRSSGSSGAAPGAGTYDGRIFII